MKCSVPYEIVTKSRISILFPTAKQLSTEDLS